MLTHRGILRNNLIIASQLELAPPTLLHFSLLRRATLMRLLVRELNKHRCCATHISLFSDKPVWRRKHLWFVCMRRVANSYHRRRRRDASVWAWAAYDWQVIVRLKCVYKSSNNIVKFMIIASRHLRIKKAWTEADEESRSSFFERVVHFHLKLAECCVWVVVDDYDLFYCSFQGENVWWKTTKQINVWIDNYMLSSWAAQRRYRYYIYCEWNVCCFAVQPSTAGCSLVWKWKCCLNWYFIKPSSFQNL